jgi:hypothetical protein
MIIMGAMPAQHFSGVSHARRRSRQVDHDFAGAVRLTPGDGFMRYGIRSIAETSCGVRGSRCALMRVHRASTGSP